MKGIIYIRVSSDEQVKGTSLEHQEESCRRYCRDRGIDVLKIFHDEGRSAKTTNRAEFLRAIEFCRKNKEKVEAFVVLRLDRFSRNTYDHFYIQKTLVEYGTTLHSATENIEGMSGKFYSGIMAVFNQFENDVRTQRVIDGMSKKIDQGIFPWKPPIGYICQHVRKRDEKKTKPDPPDSKTFSIIQRGLKEYAKGLYSQAELARLLDTWGLKTIRGKKTAPQLVDRILGMHLKFYAGILENPWTGKEIKGLHIPMISKDEMYTIQLVRSGKARLAKRDRFNPLFPLRRTIICDDCHRPYTASSPRGNGGRYFYYHCSNKQCPAFGKGISKLDLEKDFIKHVRKFTPKERVLVAFKETVLDLWEEKGQEFTLAAKKYEKEIDNLEDTKKKIHEFLENGTYNQTTFRERIAEIDNQVAVAKISLNEANIEKFDIEGTITYANNFISDLGRQWFDLAPQLRPRFQKLVFPEGLPYSKANGFGTAKLGLIYEISRRSHGNLSQMVRPAGVEPATLSLKGSTTTSVFGISSPSFLNCSTS